MRPRIPFYTTLVMSGGGVRGLGLLGALQYLADQNRLSSIHKFVGTSVGAIVGYLIAIGYSPIEIMIQINQCRMLETFVQSLNVMDLIHHGGAMNFFVLHEFLEDMTIAKIGHVLTLQQLHDEFGKHLVCCTYNYDHRTCEYVDYRKHPNMPCLTALRMTSSLPFVFHPFTYEGSVYVDGAVMDSFPVSQITSEDVALAVRLQRSSSSSSTTTPKKRPRFQLLSYILEMLSIPMDNLHRLLEETAKHRARDTVHIPLSVEAFHWTLSMAERFDMFSMGYDAMRRHYQPNYIIPWTASSCSNQDSSSVVFTP